MAARRPSRTACLDLRRAAPTVGDHAEARVEERQPTLHHAGRQVSGSKSRTKRAASWASASSSIGRPGRAATLGVLDVTG